MARGPLALVNEITARKNKGLIVSLTASLRASPRVGCVTVDNSGDGSVSNGLINALCSPYPDVRETARRFCILGARSLQSYGDVAAVDYIRPTFEKMMTILFNERDNMKSALATYIRWEEIFKTVDEIILLNDAFAMLLWPHLDTVLAIGLPVLYGFWKLNNEDRFDFDFGKNYLNILSTVLVRYNHRYISYDGGQNGGGYNNYPSARPRVGRGNAGDLPEHAWEFLFGDPEFLRRLLMPGCVCSHAAENFLKWLWHNNLAKHDVIVKNVIEHLDDLEYEDNLAAEMPHLVEVFMMNDELQRDRYK